MTEIVIPEYITHVQLAKARKPKYFKKGTATARKRAAKYKHKLYTWNKDGWLVGPSGERVVANSKSAGTPRFLKINGQQLYSGNMNAMVRSKVVNEIKDFMRTHIPSGVKMQYPVRIESDLYTPMAAKNWDLDNQWIYHKCFLDALVSEGCLPDDNIMFVTQAPAFRYFPVDTLEERKIVYRIVQEDRDEILKHPAYVAYHGWGTSDDGPTSESLSF